MAPDRISRKKFLRLAGMGATALAFTDVACTGARPVRPKIGFQLYTVRREIESDLDGTIGRIADQGFAGVETYPLPQNITLSRAAEVFRTHGLDVFGMHTGMPAGVEKDLILRSAEAYRCDHVIYPGWPEGEKFKDEASTKRTADSYNEAAAFLKTQGLRFGLHNHWWEFEKVDGLYPFYYLLEHLDAEVFFELDTYWIKTGGLDPAAVVRDFGKRAPFLHIKDGPATQNDAMYAHVPAGTGTLDFPSIVKAGAGNTQWMVVEFDEYAGDIFEAMRASYTYLRSSGFADGRP